MCISSSVANIKTFSINTTKYIDFVVFMIIVYKPVKNEMMVIWQGSEKLNKNLLGQEMALNHNFSAKHHFRYRS